MLPVTTHCARLPANLVLAKHLLSKVVHHDLGLVTNGLAVALDIAAQFLAGLLHIEFGIAFDGLGHAVVAFHRRVVLEHVEDEAFLNRLLHGVAVEWPMLDVVTDLEGDAENLQRLVLGCGREGKIAGVGQQFARFDDPVDLVLGGLVFVPFAVFRQRPVHGGGGTPALTRVRLVNDDREFLAAMGITDCIQHERKRLHCRNDDLLALLDEVGELLGL